jgi:hypothetical protein
VEARVLEALQAQVEAPVQVEAVDLEALQAQVEALDLAAPVDLLLSLVSTTPNAPTVCPAKFFPKPSAQGSNRSAKSSSARSAPAFPARPIPIAAAANVWAQSARPFVLHLRIAPRPALANHKLSVWAAKAAPSTCASLNLARIPLPAIRAKFAATFNSLAKPMSPIAA